MDLDDLDRVLAELTDRDSRLAFEDLPDSANVFYAVWVDGAGAAEITAVAPEPVPEGIVYVGQSVTQGARRHLAHNQIGSLTLMKNLAAVFRTTWRLEADRRGERLLEPGLDRLRTWMGEHLTATMSHRGSTPTRDVLVALDPCLRLQGWAPERTDLRRHLSDQRAELDRNH